MPPTARSAVASKLVKISRQLSDEVSALRFASPVEYVYNPLDYARAPHEKYLRTYGRTRKRVLLLGMNPGPFGMAQTGVPFGDIAMVRDWLGLRAKVSRPEHEHEKRPIQGFDCPRSEVSGTRLWGWAKERFGTAEAFFEDFFVVNYCPLVFLESTGRNRTPDKLPVAEREALETTCDRALLATAKALDPEWIIGVGAFAKKRAEKALQDTDMQISIGSMLHPSPASPKANRGWAPQAEQDLVDLGVL